MARSSRRPTRNLAITAPPTPTTSSPATSSRVERPAFTATVRVMDMEKRIKLIHMSLVIQIKNLLTAEQRETLRGLRGGGHRRPGH